MEIERDRGMIISTALLIGLIKQAAARGEAQEVIFHRMGDKKHFLPNDEALNHLQAKLDAGINLIETGG